MKEIQTFLEALLSCHPFHWSFFFLTGKRIQRVFFGSELGKGEADGESSVINKALDRADSSGRLTVRNAED